MGWGWWCCCCRRIPQRASECLFFLFFFLKNSSYSNLLLQTSAWLLTQPTSPTSLGTDRSRSVIAQLFPAKVHSLSGCTLPLCICHFVLICPLLLQASRSLLLLLKPCLAGEGAVDLAVSQETCGRPPGGGELVLVPALVPGTLLS